MDLELGVKLAHMISGALESLDWAPLVAPTLKSASQDRTSTLFLCTTQRQQSSMPFPIVVLVLLLLLACNLNCVLLRYLAAAELVRQKRVLRHLPCVSLVP